MALAFVLKALLGSTVDSFKELTESEIMNLVRAELKKQRADTKNFAKGKKEVNGKSSSTIVLSPSEFVA